MTSFNVMAACNFDLLFTFVMAGWEGAAHDTRIFLDAICRQSVNFPNPPPGIQNFYICMKDIIYVHLTFSFSFTRKILFS